MAEDAASRAVLVLRDAGGGGGIVVLQPEEKEIAANTVNVQAAIFIRFESRCPNLDGL
jgi:hypothetical protein